VTWPTGDIDAAYSHIEAAIARAEAIDPDYTLVAVLAQALMCWLWREDPQRL
jgi:hypothetical protein